MADVADVNSYSEAKESVDEVNVVAVSFFSVFTFTERTLALNLLLLSYTAVMFVTSSYNIYRRINSPRQKGMQSQRRLRMPTPTKSRPMLL